MLLGRLRIRGKLVLLVFIPLLSTVGLAVPVVLDRVAAAQRAGETADTVRLASRIGSLVQDLQQERVMSVGLLLGRVQRSELIQKATTVDDRVADLRADYAGRLSAETTAALDGVHELAELRTLVLARAATPSQVMEAYGPIDMALIDSLQLPSKVDTTVPAGRQVLALDALLRADEGLGACATLIVLVKATSNPRVSASYIACMAALQVDNLRFRSLITPEQYQLALLDDAAVAARTSPTFLVDSVQDPIAAIRDVPLDALFPSVRSMITLGQFVEKKIVADVIAQTTADKRWALTAAWLVAGAAGLVLLTVMLLSVAVARTVARPLTRLTRSADRVARVAEAELVRVADDESDSGPPVRLDPVDVRARDEIGDLARAFERVQSTAARLVERQVAGRRNVAQMFGHVGRRTQNLVGRQIALIDRLERQETDPGRLAHLYRLDHISSRLRRNAGSLVVLSGATGSDGHVAPVPLADVVRLALGEIEDYTRVDVRVAAEISAAPAIAGDLVLALAELMENATVFSPPHTRVVVSGELTEIGARICLVDRGIGMTEDRLAEENARLTRRERLDLAPTEVLGLFVVGRLARRHGWTVRLAPTAGGGVTARLDVPHALLVVRPADPAGATVARAAVPARDRRSPAAAIDPARSGRALTTAPADSPAATFDPALLSRATRTMAAGGSWDAFGAGAAPTGGTAFLKIRQPDPDAAEDPATPGGLPRRRRPDQVAGRPAPTGADVPVAGRPPAPAPQSVEMSLAPSLFAPAADPPWAEAPPVPAAPAPSLFAPAAPPSWPPPGGAGTPTVRQRVPGATLPPAEPAVGPVDATGADPDAARALVEQVQSGVRRAEQSGWADLGATPGRPRLSRRVPGANLAVTPPQQAQVSQPPQDPTEVRELISQFEAGVDRALREVNTDHRHDEEESSR
ncbi:nitrate- and nitrite sensing domain-containing protein [Micromonospora sp. U56]|uniref:sensor histidine kinase n=1 Tax=Micromonospora sp. U56 TaxID=2824900 RepID=UPI001B37701B|nr:nitrate- and nitrite sensing domain-containing protein [Micromonospora sp. U56]MBQ0891686.1 nitrate- and nitrite sensing domain-containing protein [Micromonospora sp. U56]